MTNQLYTIISNVLNIPLKDINDELGQESNEAWDSFNTYILLDEIETQFKVKFTLEETLNIKKVSDLKKLLQKHSIKLD